MYVCVVASVSASTYLLMQEQLDKSAVSKIQRLVDSPAKARQEFAPRIASVFLVKAFYTGQRKQMKERLVVYFALSMALLGAIYWLMSPRASLLLMYGTFAALYYCTTPITLDYWYPWDIPALVLSALSLLLALRQKVLPLAVLSALSVLFKETLLLSALYICFFPKLTLKLRLRWCAAAVALGVALRVIAEKLTRKETHHADFLHDGGKPENALRVVQNLRELFSPQINHLLWANAGLLLLVLLFPAGNGVLRGARYIALVFLCGIFLLGKVSEYRIFLELLPVSLLLAYRLFQGYGASSGDRASKAWPG